MTVCPPMPVCGNRYITGRGPLPREPIATMESTVAGFAAVTTASRTYHASTVRFDPRLDPCHHCR